MLFLFKRKIKKGFKNKEKQIVLSIKNKSFLKECLILQEILKFIKNKNISAIAIHDVEYHTITILYR